MEPILSSQLYRNMYLHFYTMFLNNLYDFKITQLEPYSVITYGKIIPKFPVGFGAFPLASGIDFLEMKNRIIDD